MRRIRRGVNRRVQAVLARYSGADAELERTEAELLDRYRKPAEEIGAVFLVASPRTGSTMLYQMMARYLDLHFFSNFVCERFPRHPVTGTVIERGLLLGARPEIPLASVGGETAGEHEPNEATVILDNWFERGHPSERVAGRTTDGGAERMTRALGAIGAYTGRPVVIKNAWNCFRIAELARLLPAARFVWLRRDIVKSAHSTLAARRTQGDPNVIWNSASPANYHEIRKLPYIEQVVQQQYWTNAAVERDLRAHVQPANALEIWYEDVVADPAATLRTLARFVGQVDTDALETRLARDPVELRAPAMTATDADAAAIREYATANFPDSVREA